MNHETADATHEQPVMDVEDEAAFVRLLMSVIDQHQLGTPEFIKRHIAAFDAFDAPDMAEFWRDALATYERAYAMAAGQVRGDRCLKVVS